MKHIGIELYYIKDGCRYMMGCNIDANPLITSENNEAWARYLRDKLSTLVTEEAMQSPEFQKIEADIAERIRHEKEWAAGAAERERKERQRNFLQIVKYMCKHFVSDEHWTMYDDMYDPDYSCELIADSLNKAGKAGKLSATDISYFHEAWSEIQTMEACQSYGIADYKFDM